MLALKPSVTRDRIAKIKDPFVRGLARQRAEKKYDRKARAITAEPYEPVKDLADRLRKMCIRDSGIGDGRRSGGYRQGARSPFQGGDALFENVCRGVHQDVYKRQAPRPRSVFPDCVI